VPRVITNIDVADPVPGHGLGEGVAAVQVLDESAVGPELGDCALGRVLGGDRGVQVASRVEDDAADLRLRDCFKNSAYGRSGCGLRRHGGQSRWCRMNRGRASSRRCPDTRPGAASGGGRRWATGRRAGRHRVRAPERHPVGRAPAGDGLRVGRRLLAAVPALAAPRRVEEAVGGRGRGRGASHCFRTS
jgi:hypothetical protein